jgi:hypothetical protein
MTSALGRDSGSVFEIQHRPRRPSSPALGAGRARRTGTQGGGDGWNLAIAAAQRPLLPARGTVAAAQRPRGFLFLVTVQLRKSSYRHKPEDSVQTAPRPAHAAGVWDKPVEDTAAAAHEQRAWREGHRYRRRPGPAARHHWSHLFPVSRCRSKSRFHCGGRRREGGRRGATRAGS